MDLQDALKAYDQVWNFVMNEWELIFWSFIKQVVEEIRIDWWKLQTNSLFCIFNMWWLGKKLSMIKRKKNFKHKIWNGNQILWFLFLFNLDFISFILDLGFIKHVTTRIEVSRIYLSLFVFSVLIDFEKSPNQNTFENGSTSKESFKAFMEHTQWEWQGCWRFWKWIWLASTILESMIAGNSIFCFNLHNMCWTWFV